MLLLDMSSGISECFGQVRIVELFLKLLAGNAGVEEVQI